MTEKELLAMIVAGDVMRLASESLTRDLSAGKGISARDHEQEAIEKLSAVARRVLASA